MNLEQIMNYNYFLIENEIYSICYLYYSYCNIELVIHYYIVPPQHNYNSDYNFMLV